MHNIDLQTLTNSANMDTGIHDVFRYFFKLDAFVL